MSLLTELVILVGGVSINMSRRWRWKTQRVNNTKTPSCGALRLGAFSRGEPVEQRRPARVALLHKQLSDDLRAELNAQLFESNNQPDIIIRAPCT
jgi:hypothetical protein